MTKPKQKKTLRVTATEMRHEWHDRVVGQSEI